MNECIAICISNRSAFYLFAVACVVFSAHADTTESEHIYMPQSNFGIVYFKENMFWAFCSCIFFYYISIIIKSRVLLYFLRVFR